LQKKKTNYFYFINFYFLFFIENYFLHKIFLKFNLKNFLQNYYFYTKFNFVKINKKKKLFFLEILNIFFYIFFFKDLIFFKN